MWNKMKWKIIITNWTIAAILFIAYYITHEQYLAILAMTFGLLNFIIYGLEARKQNKMFTFYCYTIGTPIIIIGAIISLIKNYIL